MKQLYKIQDRNGATLCHQYGTSAEDALYTAKAYYGFKNAKRAVLANDGE